MHRSAISSASGADKAAVGATNPIDGDATMGHRGASRMLRYMRSAMHTRTGKRGRRKGAEGHPMPPLPASFLALQRELPAPTTVTLHPCLPRRPRCFCQYLPGCILWSDSAPQEGEHQNPHTLDDKRHRKLLGCDCNIVVHQRLNGNRRHRGTWYARYVVSCGRVAAILCAIQIMFNRVLATEPGVYGPVCCTG